MLPGVIEVATDVFAGSGLLGLAAGKRGVERLNDFCEGFGDRYSAMHILRHQFLLAGINVVDPTVDSLMRLADLLSIVESQVMGAEEAGRKRLQRKAMLVKLT